ncbi:hypothetical protein Misp01_44040 [Microtetraspora sp. NBRC 13810]|uniref:hypothetical protein n=1 Tax=Microtetraspora sp. NBRC 13810 TaxID=3030990 RepID=UPI0024A32108|nr:hypothetical protein [Microtetraspora sp. NBRC 13810]GLW09275.1 hypothetical protein Misp01_44040 [Microtetraspora sp. NBRC 13810]
MDDTRDGAAEMTGTGEPVATDEVTRVARALLYEGYLLWPYRRSALKNNRRWTLGGVHPRGYRDAGDSWLMRTQIPIEAGPDDTVDVLVRFLHVVSRDVARPAARRSSGQAPGAAPGAGQGPGSGLEPVVELVAGGERYVPREEAAEREFGASGLVLADLVREPAVVEIDVPGEEQVEWVEDPPGRRAGALVRSCRPLRGRVVVSAERMTPDVCRITVEVVNTTRWAGDSRTEALERAFVSAHTILRSPRGRFVSLMDPPDALREVTRGCGNAGTWPVLAGPEGDRHTVLSSPIILYDHPKIAPESPGDLFDATEIDQLLTLSVLCLTEDEQREIREGDPLGREILDRCAALPQDRLMRLHGTFRAPGPTNPATGSATDRATGPASDRATSPATDRATGPASDRATSPATGPATDTATGTAAGGGA